MVEGVVGRPVAGRSFKERQYQEREELILQVAEQMLIARGYHEMSMDDIAAQVGIARGTLYRHFASKEDLVFAFVKRDLTVFVQHLEEILATNTASQEKLEAALRMTYKRFSGKYMLLLDNGVILSILPEKAA